MNKYLLLVSLFCCLAAKSQKSASDYLKHAHEVMKVKNIAGQVQYLEQNVYRSPILREMEVRIRTNDLGLSPDDYRFRLGILNPAEMKANRNYHSSQLIFVKSQYLSELNKELVTRYNRLISYRFLVEHGQLLNEVTRQLDQKFQLQNSLSDLMRLDELKLKLELRRQGLAFDLERITGLLEADSLYFDFEWIGLPQMNSVIMSLDSANLLSVTLAQNRHDLAEKDFSLEKARSWSNIGFVQAEYDANSDNAFNEQLGFQVGLNIPVFNTDRPKLQREKLELIEREQSISEENEDVGLEKDGFIQTFQRAQAGLRLIDKALLKYQKVIREVNVENIEDFVDLIDYVTELKSMKLSYEKDIITNYVDLLGLIGKLASTPRVNYLSQDLRPLD
ncbi:MAG: hypothetical protein JXQ90_04235 [Cyclobacteriaceae bacterium]